MKTEFTDVSRNAEDHHDRDPERRRRRGDRPHRQGLYESRRRSPGFGRARCRRRSSSSASRTRSFTTWRTGLIPRAIEDALQERGIEPVDTPNVKDVALREGQPLKFTAAIETVPPFDPGDLSTISLKRPRVAIDDPAVAGTLERLRERAAKYEPVEGRAVTDGDTVVPPPRSQGPGRGNRTPRRCLRADRCPGKPARL